MEGTAECIIDGTRALLPARFRDEFGASSVVISKGLDSCLFVHTVVGYERFIAALLTSVGQDARAIRRFFVSDAMELKQDARGRVSIDRRLMEYAGIRTRAVWRGEGEHLELWDKDRFDSWRASGARRSAICGLLAVTGSVNEAHRSAER